MNSVKCECGKIIKNITIFPLFCSCGRVFTENNYEWVKEEVVERFVFCKHRKEELGKVDCNCNGIKSVFKCDIHNLCMIRKLKPGLPTVEFKDGTKEKKEIVYCNVCQDREESDGCCGE